MNKIEIIPLGTVSPYIKGDHNCPGFLIIYNDKRILLDCGNGITRLLNFPDDLENMNIIISHYHKDHHGDLGAVQYASKMYYLKGFNNCNINIYLPKNDYKHNKEAIVSNTGESINYIDYSDESLFYIDDLKISFENNNSHSIECFMIKLENEDFKIVYTSDIGTTNIDGLIKFCKNADIIICESALLKNKKENTKGHMSAFDAGMVARKAGAEKLYLTHTWPENDKKLYLKEAKENFENIFMAIEGEKIILEK